MAAVLIAVSPPVLFQVVQPMNDIMTAALWMAVFVALVHRRWTLAGVCCGLALLVRPNLLPLAAVAGVFVLWSLTQSPNPVIPNPRRARFCLAALPFGLLSCGSTPSSTAARCEPATASSTICSALEHSDNAARYLRWLIETHTPFPLLALAAPFFVATRKARGCPAGDRPHRRDVFDLFRSTRHLMTGRTCVSCCRRLR